MVKSFAISLYYNLSMPKRPFPGEPHPSKKIKSLTYQQTITEAFKDLSVESMARLENLLPRTLSLALCDNIFRQIAYTIKKNCSVQITANLLTRAINDLNLNLIDEKAVNAWLNLSSDKGLQIRHMLENLATIIGTKNPQNKLLANFPALTVNTVNTLLMRLNKTESDKSNISLAIYNTSLLVDKLDGKIELNTFIPLLKSLLSPRVPLTAQVIAIALYGLGKFAERFDGYIENKLIISFLNQLIAFESKDLLAKDISMSIYGIGLLAEEGKIHGEINCTPMLLLFQRLLECQDTNPQARSNSLQGLGQLAEKGILKGCINCKDLVPMLSGLSGFLHIGMSFHALGQLAEREILEGKINIDNVLPFFTLLQDPNTNAKTISSFFHGLKQLAKEGKIEGTLTYSTLTPLLQKFLDLDKEIAAIDASMVLSALTKFAIEGTLSDEIDSGMGINLLEKLIQDKEEAKSLSVDLHALGQLAEHDALNGTIDSNRFAPLLQILLDFDKKVNDVQCISMSLHALGVLAEKGILYGKITYSNTLVLLIQKLFKCHSIDAQAIGNCLKAFSRLINHHVLAANELSQLPLQGLINKLFTLPSKAKDSQEVLLFIAALLQQDQASETYIGITQFERLIDLSLSCSYLHPRYAAELIHVLRLFKKTTENLERSFEIILKALKELDAHLLPEHLQTQLAMDAKHLASLPDWQRELNNYLQPSKKMALAQLQTTGFNSDLPDLREGPQGEATKTPEKSSKYPLPTVKSAPSTEPSNTNTNTLPQPERRQTTSEASEISQETWRASCRNAIFKAIAHKQYDSLCQLLATHQAVVQPRRPTNTNGTRAISLSHRTTSVRETSNLSRSVIDFLTKTPAQALRKLITQTSASYFILLLQTLSLHERYQLAQNHTLHPIFLYLPKNALQEWINVSISPFQLYRDHQALLNVFDALTIRCNQKPDEQPIIFEAQKNLLAIAIEFHEKCNHHRVLNTLYPLQRELNRQQSACLIDLNPKVTLNTAPQKPKPSVSSNRPQTALSRPNQTYLYTSEDINRLILWRLGIKIEENVNSERPRTTYPHLHVLASASMNSNAQGNRIGNVIRSFLDNTRLPNDIPQTLIIPFNIGQHWMGLSLELQNGLITKGTYYNSLRGQNDHLNSSILKELIECNLTKNNRVIIEKARYEIKQPDGTSCGPFLVENIIRDIKNKGWKRPTSRENHLKLMHTIRQMHFSLVEKNDPDYFKEFSQQSNAQEFTPQQVSQRSQSTQASNAERLFTQRVTPLLSSPSNTAQTLFSSDAAPGPSQQGHAENPSRLFSQEKVRRNSRPTPSADAGLQHRS